MPHVDDQFAGHMFADDPRSPLWAARGCVWPTIPAYHFLAKSTNATGAYTFFNSEIVLMEMITIAPNHDTAVWFWELPALPDIWISAVKTQDPSDGTGYRWAIDIHFPGMPASSQKTIVRPHEKCNGEIDIGSMLANPPITGDTGDTFQLLPVVWDETVPPT